jgi:MarR family 2-MHQ and catechol resistance regulon transcriptional repressor
MSESAGNQAGNLSERERLERTAARYAAAFPAERPDAFRAHLAVVRAGTTLARAVTAFLAARHEINTARYSLLRALYFADERRLSQSDLARELAVTSPNVTQLIDALEHEGYVERVVSETDRRVTFAHLTSAGERRCEDLVPAMAAYMEETCASLSTEELRTLTDLLTRFRENLPQPGEGD